jgi:deoxyribose-phosphate aldolase
MTLPAYEEIAQMIDHSLLRPELTEAEVESGCELAMRYEVATVCVRPADLPLAVARLASSRVKPTTVVGFPHGSQTRATKLFEAREALEAGAAELDAVLNIGRLRSKDFAYVEDELRDLSRLAHAHGALLKVIFENAYLDDELIIAACGMAARAACDFVKTSTGFASSGATDHDLKLMRQHSPEWMRVKAAGGVRTLARALEVRALGCSRFGATATAAILDELKLRLAAEAAKA